MTVPQFFSAKDVIALFAHEGHPGFSGTPAATLEAMVAETRGEGHAFAMDATSIPPAVADAERAYAEHRGTGMLSAAMARDESRRTAYSVIGHAVTGGFLAPRLDAAGQERPEWWKHAPDTAVQEEYDSCASGCGDARLVPVLRDELIARGAWDA